MASSPSSALCLIFFSFLLPLLSALSLAKPHALVLPVKKDRYTNQYVTRINARTPLVPLGLVVDLGGQYLWVDCDSSYVSSSYRPVHCNSPPYRPGCSNQSCSVMPVGPSEFTSGELSQDLFAFRSTDGSSPGPVVTSGDFIFSCAPRSLVRGLARGASGMAGLGRNRVAMPVQLAVEFGLRPKFAICLSSSTASDGVIFFGDGPYTLLPNVDASKVLMYTPLFINKVPTGAGYYKGEKSVEYFIGVKSIKVNDEAVPLNATLLKISGHGVGGTKISTVDPYTVLEKSIYKAVTDAFVNAISGIKRVAAVAPFQYCYNACWICCL